MRTLAILLIVLTLVMVGCAQQGPKQPKTQESFRTIIKHDGTKQFSYTLIVEVPADADAKGPDGRPKGPPGYKPKRKPGGAMTNPYTDFFEDTLNEKLNSTGFCRSGYRLIDKQTRLGAYQLTARCNEPANDADREKFPNPAVKKVREEVIE